MAARAHARGGWLAPGESVAGLGCTATLATDRPKRGEHRFHLAVHRAEPVTGYSLVLAKGGRDRAGEEAVLDAVILNALAAAFGIEERLTPALLPGETIEVESEPGSGALAAFLRGEVHAVWVALDGQIRVNSPAPAVLVPGAFNPLHEAHCSLAEAAGRLVGGAVAFELSITNVDKPPLGGEELRRRMGQFAWKAPLWLTRAPTFAEKAARFPGVVFAVGVDTAERIIAPRYYGNSAEAMAAALEAIRARGCRFLVAGRVDAVGRFLRLEELAIPAAFRDLFMAIPEQVFRVDISSTQLRVGCPDP
jgi:hypothetical protein